VPFKKRGLFCLLLFLISASGCSLNPFVKKPQEPIIAEKRPLDSLEAQAIFEVASGRKIKGRATVFAKAPDKLRIEVLGPFSEIQALFIGNGGLISAYESGDIGTLPAYDSMDHYPFSSKELASLLLGNTKNFTNQEVTGEGGGLCIKIEKKGNGAVDYTATLSEFKEISGGIVPFSIKITYDGRQIAVRYSQVDADPVLPDEIFSLE
jgi:outer membrane lipoprotein-sorting protein